MDHPSKMPFNYETYLILNGQRQKLDFQVKSLYDKWRQMDLCNFRIKDEYSQSKMLFKIESILYDGHDNNPNRNTKRLRRRSDNLKKRIEQRFAEEFPERVVDTLKAHNLYLVNKSKLDALRICVVAYHSGLTDI